jgi:hypothetical protein
VIHRITIVFALIAPGAEEVGGNGAFGNQRRETVPILRLG